MKTATQTAFTLSQLNLKMLFSVCNSGFFVHITHANKVTSTFVLFFSKYTNPSHHLVKKFCSPHLIVLIYIYSHLL